MIVQEAELRAALGLRPTITDQQQARLMLAVAAGHAAVRKFLHYNPEQKTYSNQLYPRAEASALELWEGVWDVDASRRRAVWEARDSIFQYLQLEHLPVREITEVRVDPSARFAQQSGDFGSGTVQVVGTDYYVEWDERVSDNSGICRTGQLIAVGSWPVKPGTVQVAYRAGYSPTEFAGPAASTDTSDNGYITVKGVDASPIKAACMLECMRSYHTFAQWSQSSLTGMLIPGPKQSESLGSYSYSLASGAAAALLTSMAADISPQAAGLLNEFAHYGIHLL